MSKISNISAINLGVQNNTTEFFNNFFDQELLINAADDQAIVAFFEKRTEGKIAAKMMAGALILTCASRGLEPIAVLDNISSLDTLEFNTYMAMIFNLSRVNTSKMGVLTQPRISKYVSRAILP